MRLDYAQFLELEMFTRFGSVTDAQVKGKIERGRRIRAVLSQPQYAPLAALPTRWRWSLRLQEGLLDRLAAGATSRNSAPRCPATSIARRAGAVDKIQRTGELDDRPRGAQDLPRGAVRFACAERAASPERR